MALVSGSWVVDILCLLVTLVFLLYLYLSRNNNYFKDRGIPYIKPVPFIGSLDAFTTSQYDLSRKLYDAYKDEKFFGYFQSTVPTLVMNDPELIQRILVKDFAHFHDRPLPASEHDPLEKNLFNLKGQRWRFLRQKLMPTFSTGKIRKMFDQLILGADHLLEDVSEACVTQECVDVNKMIMKMTVEIIGRTAFGLDLGKGMPHTKEFEKHSKILFDNDLRQFAIFFFQLVTPELLTFLNVTLFPRKVYEYFYNLVVATKEYRKKNNVRLDDYFQLLLSLQEAEERGELGTWESVADDNQLMEPTQTQAPERMFTDQDLTSHAFVFFVAGVDTVATTLSMMLYHIAKDPAIEARIRDDVHRALTVHSGWTYEAVKDMAYLDQVIQETLRMYPTVALNDRECTIPWTIPGTNIVVEKGTFINIPVAGLQMDPRYYADPQVFNPDRFADNNFKPNATFMPFGNGPRLCIAMRFAILEMKICLAKIFNEFSAEVNSKTKEPFTFDPSSFSPYPNGGIWINFNRSSKIST